jgi:hypothetical protein
MMQSMVIIDKVMVVLQSHMDLLEAVTSSCSETCLTSCHDRSEIIKVKVENVTDIKEEDDPVQMTFPKTKTKCEVSCISVCTMLVTFHKYPVSF